MAGETLVDQKCHLETARSIATKLPVGAVQQKECSQEILGRVGWAGNY